MVVRAICISESTPSCIRAPPEDGMTMSGASCSTASRAAASRLSPTAVPMEPPRKPKSKAATTAGAVPMVPCATTMASSWPVLLRASRRRSA